MVTKRKVRIFYATLAIWCIASLIFSAEVTYAVTSSEGLAQLVGIWLILSSGPALPIFWLWILERSPWTLGFLAPVISAGLLASWLFYDQRDLQDVWFLPPIWTILACFEAWLLKDARQIGAVSWKRAAQTSATFPTVIDHGMYIRLLDDQHHAGFPSVLRVHEHFVERLPEVVPALKEQAPVKDQPDLTAKLAYARSFMLQKISYELAFLCAVSFFERMCGPNFRYTKQYRSLIAEIIEFEYVPNDQNLFEDFLSNKAVTATDLDKVLRLLDKQRERDESRLGEKKRDDNTTIALTAISLLLKENLVPERPGLDFTSSFYRMTKGAMNQMRETFSNQKTKI